MKYLFNMSRIQNWWNWFGIEYAVWDIYLCHFFLIPQQLEITKLVTRENIGPRKCSRKKKKILDPRNTQKKMFCAHEIPTRKKFKNFSRRNNGIMILDRRWHATHEIWYTLSFNTFFSLINLIIDKDSHAN